jgi:hypothetical protein
MQQATAPRRRRGELGHDAALQMMMFSSLERMYKFLSSFGTRAIIGCSDDILAAEHQYEFKTLVCVWFGGGRIADRNRALEQSGQWLFVGNKC